MRKKRRIIGIIFLLRTPIIISGLLGLFLIYSAVNSIPPRTITIEAGVKGGLYDQYAQTLKSDLRSYGYWVKVSNRSDSNLIIGDLNNRNNNIDGGFISQFLNKTNFPNVNQIGTIENAPIYFITKPNSKIKSITQLTTQNIALYPTASSAYNICRQVLDLYGVNQNISPDPIGNETQIINAVLNNQDPIGCFLTSATDPQIANAVATGKLTILNLTNTIGAAIHSTSLQQVTLQVGSLNVNPAVPTKTLNILAAPIEFFVKSNLNRSLITAITASLKSEFAAPTPFSQANTFPNSNYLNFPTDTRALLILKGGYPWEYRHFPFPVAGFMDQWLNTYGAIFGFILVLLTTLDHIGFRKFIIKLQNARVRSADKYIDHLIESMQTRSLTNTEIKHLSLIEKWVNKQALDAQYLKRKIDGIKE